MLYFGKEAIGRTTTEVLQVLQREIHTAVAATADENGLPVTREGTA